MKNKKYPAIPTRAYRIRKYIEIKHDNPSLTKQNALRAAGYSESTSRAPSLVEKSQTYRELTQALAHGAGTIVAENLAEYQRRPKTHLSQDQLIDHADKLSRTMSRLVPPEGNKSPIRSIFARVIEDEPKKDVDK